MTAAGLFGGLSWVIIRDVTDSGLESAPEYEFGSFEIIFKCDSGSGSFQADPLESAPIVDQLQMAYKINIFCPKDTYFLIKTSLFWSQQDLINKKVKIIAFQWLKDEKMLNFMHLTMILEPIPLLEPIPCWNRLHQWLFWPVESLWNRLQKNWNRYNSSP